MYIWFKRNEMENDKIDFQNIYKSLIPKIQEENKGISHQQFIEGVESGTMGIKVMTGEPSHILVGKEKVKFTFFVGLYTFAPIIAVSYTHLTLPTNREV